MFSTFLQDLTSFIALLNIYKAVAALSNHYKSIDTVLECGSELHQRRVINQQKSMAVV